MFFFVNHRYLVAGISFLNFSRITVIMLRHVHHWKKLTIFVTYFSITDISASVGEDPARPAYSGRDGEFKDHG